MQKTDNPHAYKRINAVETRTGLTPNMSLCEQYGKEVEDEEGDGEPEDAKECAKKRRRVQASA